MKFRGLAGKVARKAGWGLADQAFSSITNFALAIVVARSVSVLHFGIFTLAFSAYTASLGGSRAFISQPLAVRFSNRTRAQWVEGTRAGTGTAFTAGAAIGVLCLLTGALLEGTARSTVLALGFAMPFLLLQDAWRFAFFSARQGNHAFINDLSWALIMFPALAVVLANGWGTVSVFVLIWGGSGAVAAVIGCWQARVLPNPLAAREWWTRQRDLIPGFVGDFAVTSGVTRATVYLVAAIAGIRASASLRGAGILLGPVTLVFQSVPGVTLPEAVRLLAKSHAGLRRAMVLLSVGLSSVALGCGLIALVIPDSLGEALLGDTWSSARLVVVFLALALAASAANTGAMVGMRALGDANRMFRTRLVAAPLIAIGVVIGAALAGAVGAASGNALATVITDFLWWRQFAIALRSHRARQGGDGRATEPVPLPVSDPSSLP